MTVKTWFALRRTLMDAWSQFDQMPPSIKIDLGVLEAAEWLSFCGERIGSRRAAAAKRVREWLDR